MGEGVAALSLQPVVPTQTPIPSHIFAFGVIQVILVEFIFSHEIFSVVTRACRVQNFWTGTRFIEYLLDPEPASLVTLLIFPRNFFNVYIY